MPGPVTDQALVTTDHQLDRLTQLGIPSHRAVIRAVQAHDLGQHMRVPGIRLRPELECRSRYRATAIGGGR